MIRIRFDSTRPSSHCECSERERNAKGMRDDVQGRRADERTSERSIAMCVVLTATVMRFCTLLRWCPSAQSTISSIYKLRCNFCCKWLKRHLLGWHFFLLHFVAAFIFLHSGAYHTQSFRGEICCCCCRCWIQQHERCVVMLDSSSSYAFVVAVVAVVFVVDGFFSFILNSVFICCRCDLIRWFEGKKFHEIYIYIVRTTVGRFYSIHSSPHDVFCSN